MNCITSWIVIEDRRRIYISMNISICTYIGFDFTRFTYM